jgi:hypothetical protein
MLRIRLSIAALAAIAAGSAALAAPAGAAPVQLPFTFSGGSQFWTVPTGVTEATFTLQGAAGGGAAGGGAGGLGAEIRATIPVTPGERLTIVVGGEGTSLGIAGFNGGGGGGGLVGGGGGGAGGSTSAATDGAGGGGGAGGQSFVTASATNVSIALAAQRNDGVAVVSYEPLAAPEVRTQPTLSGVAQVGRALSCELGTWSGSPSLAVAWLRNGETIPGATAMTYTLATADGGQQVACQVTATNSAGSRTARTPAITVSLGPANATAPAVSGASAIGSRLTCSNGTWTGAPTFAYAWLRNGRAIRGQTGSTYTLGRADAGQAIQCAVTATVDGQSVTAQSVATGGPARLVILTTTALVSRTGGVTVQVACFGPTDCVVPRMTATSGQVIARAGARTIRSGSSSRYTIALGRRGRAKLRRAGSSIAVRFVCTPTGGSGGNARLSFVALNGTTS